VADGVWVTNILKLQKQPSQSTLFTELRRGATLTPLSLQMSSAENTESARKIKGLMEMPKTPRPMHTKFGEASDGSSATFARYFCPVEGPGEIWDRVTLIRLDLVRLDAHKSRKAPGLEKLAKTRIFVLSQGIMLSVYTVPCVQPEFWPARVRVSGFPFGMEPSALRKYLAVDEDTSPVTVESVCELASSIVKLALKVASTFTGSVLDKVINKSLTYRLAFVELKCESCGSSDHQTDAFECAIGTFAKIDCSLESTWWFNHPKTAPKFATVPKQKGAEAALGNTIIPVTVIIWSLGSLGYWTYFV
jgi:hypothetical protein